ncbi:hypothetical protein Agabi119p4_3819 [Agaricus bisporus var. burnettii]|uniref:C2 domain-containing protein n=1 Tax=Agaricus bisporus var. burnettii TaxID=192524 RepID=A0A8H7F5G1_AGABI|nr:hypothetical protein Agabi119p4_3819 [Agaricus bisporus var. burnettii]
MPGGKRNFLSMTTMLQTIEGAVQIAKSKPEPGLYNKFGRERMDMDSGVAFVDLEIQFIGASGLPKMDVVGTADPYFIAKIDNRISFVSKVIKNTVAPVWNELWKIKNVPTTATLQVEVMDKDEGTMTDDYIGKFETTVSAGAKEAEIQGPMLRRDRGNFWLKIESTPSPDRDQALTYPYLFNGPIRYSRHCSPTVGLLTNLDEARLYSTWKMYLRGIPIFLSGTPQHWNTKYKAAQNIFQGPASLAVRSGIQAGHRMLYARTATNAYGVINEMADVVELLHGGVSRPGSANATIQKQHMKRVKPAVYTYIISSDDDSFRFSETGAAFFVDFASKHALHSNCSETVRFSGEFHPRPKGGWKFFSDDIPDNQVEWEFVIDNNSGTYAPDKALLPQLKELMEFNFPGFGICAWDREDERLKESVEDCREYAVKYRGVGKDELQPTADAGEVTLMAQATMKRPGGRDGNDGELNNIDPISQVQGTTGHRKTNSTPSGSSGGASGYFNPPDALASYYSTSSAPNQTPFSNAEGGGRSSSPLTRDLPPSLRPQASPRTSSDYSYNCAPPRPPLSYDFPTPPPNFPIPSPNFPTPSPSRAHYPRTSSDFGYASTPPAQYGYGPPQSPLGHTIPHSVPPLSLIPGLRHQGSLPSPHRSSIDYSALPPGCAPPVKFDGQQGKPVVPRSYGYGSGSFSRYDPSSKLASTSDRSYVG